LPTPFNRTLWGAWHKRISAAKRPEVDPKLSFDLQPSAVEGCSPINVSIQDATPISHHKTRPLSPINVSIQDATPISSRGVFANQCVNTRRDPYLPSMCQYKTRPLSPPYLPLSPASDSAKSNARQWPVAACRFRCNWRRLTPPLEPDRVLIATAADSACPAASGVASSMHGQPRLTATVSSRTEFT
jgi:hypothetical protein